MKQILISASVAAIVCVLAFWLEDRIEGEDAIGVDVPVSDEATLASAGASLRIGDALIEDTWVNAARQPGSDRRTLTSAEDSVCYLIKIEISGIQGPEDSSSCAIEVDEFTGFWQLIATADEGSRSEIRCNARCFSLTLEGESP